MKKGLIITPFYGNAIEIQTPSKEEFDFLLKYLRISKFKIINTKKTAKIDINETMFFETHE